MSMKKAFAFAIPAAALIGLAVFLLGAKGTTALAANEATPAGNAEYVYASIERGAVESIVSSSGTLEPVSSVSVLARMSGRAEKVYADYNDHVEKGQVLVALDTAILNLQRKEAAAAVRKARANQGLAKIDRENASALAAKGLLADYDLATAAKSLEVAAADLEQAEASLDLIDTQLESYALVRSPISGIVLERNVDVGQSVVEGASSNASSLFILAENLARMEIEADVDELDIGSIKVGQAVRFSVEAAPGKLFSGSVRQRRLVPTTSDNVVTYKVIVDAENPDGLLLPGMTAVVEFIKESKSGVLTVPNAALRFSPSGLGEAEKARLLFAASLHELDAEGKAAALASYDATMAAQAAKASGGTPKSSGGLAGMMMPGPGGPGGPGGQKSGSGAANATLSAIGGEASAKALKTLWLLGDSGRLEALLVRVGATDGSKTEIESAGGAAKGEPGLEGVKVILKVRS